MSWHCTYDGWDDDEQFGWRDSPDCPECRGDGCAACENTGVATEEQILDMRNRAAEAEADTRHFEED
jgi:hypothetical protein